MINIFLLLVLVVFVVVYWRWQSIQTVIWAKKYQAQNLSHIDKQVLLKYMPIYRAMTDADRTALEKHIVWFLGEKRLLGRDGLKINRAMALIVAADACLLVLKQAWPLYPNVKEVLLYPSSYYVPQTNTDGAGLVNYHTSIRQGESWPGGTLVLSWHDVLEGNRLPGDGHNLVFHEFAHQLDQQTGQTNGTPQLKSKQEYADWGRVFARAYNNLKSHVAYQMPHVMHSYGATNEAEFFAVLTETFIEKPAQLKNYDPELYRLLICYFEFDPSDWQRG
ncbi:Protein MtfA [Pseudoalteromonas holothuriae]|uniref:Protein MtfA n=1 Tax=Pseudoalteromonas holothuriae TaxID=2963714 RepID=A0A9W4R294_9GAMM|nr:MULTISPECIES: M90 family metallopeptidase [unclassified Pseudoalteromonas]CAH9052296.1 Protein MtfA [Pseudoalteromonas sp. CIP111951]CAH9064019.1 Protein MtfA [Pseudoalteromonas sp. CIP111854]